MHHRFFQKEDFASIQEIQAGTSKILEKAERNESFIRVLKNSKPIGVLMSNEAFDNLIEDLCALSSPRYLARVAQARKEKKRYSLAEVKKRLGL
ncbi:type II toxin-antitoxin system Phd/YefM family antitoxin [Candidatus Uhrbacteria bacterium]|nr:type II toxin-antitoxin system Phd/YefM family antitoxin [Candidatus Uhrbacteria bacterium]